MSESGSGSSGSPGAEVGTRQRVLMFAPRSGVRTKRQVVVFAPRGGLGSGSGSSCSPGAKAPGYIRISLLKQAVVELVGETNVPFWKLHYHLVWATHGRDPIIDEHAEALIRKSIWSTAQSTKIHIHAIGMITDHVHLLASIPPSIAVSEAMRRFKGGTSHAVNDGRKLAVEFRWQAEYGALSLTDRGLPTVIEYVNNQAQRHANGNLIATLERIEAE